jgi:hypothetical protein
MNVLHILDIAAIFLVIFFFLTRLIDEKQKKQKQEPSPIRIIPKIGYPAKRGKFSGISPVSKPHGRLPGVADFDAMRESYNGGKRLAFTVHHRPDEILKVEIKPFKISATLCYTGPDHAGDLTALEFDSENQNAMEILEQFFYKYYLSNNLPIPDTQLLAYPKVELTDEGRLYYARGPTDRYYLLGIDRKNEIRVQKGLILTKNGAEWSVQKYPISLHSIITQVVDAKGPISISAYDILVPEEDLAKYDKIELPSCQHACPSATQIPVVATPEAIPAVAPIRKATCDDSRKSIIGC